MKHELFKTVCMKKWMIVLLAMIIVMPLSSDLYAASKKKKKKGTATATLPAPKKVSPYEKLLKGKNVETSKSDFITLHKVGSKLYFEIPLKYMEREILLASTVTNVTSPEFCDIGYKANNPLHLKFTKRDSSIFLRYVSTGVTTDNLQKAMNNVYGDPILYAYDVKAYNPDSTAVVIDMTTLFTTNVKDLSFFADAMMGGMVKISSSFKKEASYLDEIKAFDDNLSVKTVMSYGVSLSVMGMMKLMDDYPFTATVTRSILLLPEDKMIPRISDSRVGIFNSTKTRLSITKEDEIGNYSVAHRWRLEPKDVEAYKRGELVEPVKQIVAVSSGKGGVGKSTVASNLAVALAKLGYKVGLVDADIYGPSMPKMFGCEDASLYMVEVGGKELIEPVVKYGVKLLSIGFFVDPDSATVWRGPMASNALKQMVEGGFWDELDFMLIDLPPGTSDIHLTLVQTVALSGAIVVSTPQQVALADAVKGINMFESPGIQVPVLGLVENMSWFTPAELPDNKYYIFGKEGAKKLADEKGLRLLGQIPIVQSIMEGGENGSPVALDEDSVTGQAFIELARNVAHAVDETGETAKRVRVTK